MSGHGLVMVRRASLARGAISATIAREQVRLVIELTSRNLTLDQSRFYEGARRMEEPHLSRRERRERERSTGLPLLLVGALVVLALVAAVWFGRGLFLSDEPSTAAPGPTGTSTSSPSAPATSATSATAEASATAETPDPLAAAVANCQVAWKLQSSASAAAARALSQWNTHIYIMNRLEAGKLTLAQAKQLWVPTTTNAERNVAAFRAADLAYRSARVACTAPAASAEGPQAEPLRQCAASTAKLDASLAKARIAIAPWETHLKDQSHFKAGIVTPAAAEAAWRALWKQGVATIGGYLNAARSAQGASCPLA